jgi:hypothetical protein
LRTPGDCGEASVRDEGRPAFRNTKFGPRARKALRKINASALDLSTRPAQDLPGIFDSCCDGG